MSQEDIERKFLEIETLFDEYKQAYADAMSWYREWQARQNGFRCRRRGEIAQSEVA